VEKTSFTRIPERTVHVKRLGPILSATVSTGLKLSLRWPEVLALGTSPWNLKADGSFIEMLISPKYPPNGNLVSGRVEIEVYSPGKSSVASGGPISGEGIKVISRVFCTFTRGPVTRPRNSTTA
jgi:hypothetical protein